MYRMLGDNHQLDGLPFSAQVFLRALDTVRSRLADKMGVSGLEARAISRVGQESGLSLSTLGDFLEVSPVITKTVVDILVSRDYIIVSGVDSQNLELTPSGHELVARMYQDFQKSINDAADSLDQERRWGLESGMLKMARKLDAEAARPRA